MINNTVIESTKIVLGTIMNNNNYILKAINILKVDDVYNVNHQLIYKTMIRLYRKNIKFDSIVLINNLKEQINKQEITISEISDIATRYEYETFNTHVQIIKEDSNKRKLESICKECISSNEDSKTIINKLQNELMNIVSQSNNDNYIPMKQAISNSIDRIEKAYNSKKGFSGISSGIIELDKAINGLERGTMTVFGARPSMGKTAFSLEMLRGIEGNVLYIQLDMTIEGMVQRMLSSEMKTENRKVGRGKLNDEEWNKLMKSATHLGKKDNIYFYSPKNPTISNILFKAQELKIKKGLDVIIIDHLTKVKPDIKINPGYEATTYVSNSLKRMAIELNIAMVVLCQLNREVEKRNDKHPTLSDLRNSGAIEEDADNIGMLYRDGYYKARESGAEIINDTLELNLLKVRNGMLGNIQFEYDLKTQSLIQEIK